MLKSQICYSDFSLQSLWVYWVSGIPKGEEILANVVQFQKKMYYRIWKFKKKIVSQPENSSFEIRLHFIPVRCIDNNGIHWAVLDRSCAKGFTYPILLEWLHLLKSVSLLLRSFLKEFKLESARYSVWNGVLLLLLSHFSRVQRYATP